MKSCFGRLGLLVVATAGFVAAAVATGQTDFAQQSTATQQPPAPAPTPPTTSDTQPQVQMRGPLHEGFASPFVSGPQDAVLPNSCSSPPGRPRARGMGRLGRRPLDLGLLRGG